MEIILVQIVSTTDGKFKGVVVPLPTVGEIVDYGNTRFHCQGMTDDGNGNYKTWNSNYVITARYVATMKV